MMARRMTTNAIISAKTARLIAGSGSMMITSITSVMFCAAGSGSFGFSFTGRGMGVSVKRSFYMADLP